MKFLSFGTVTFFLLFAFSSGGIAADCTGGWKTLPNYDRSKGTPCQILGLDSHKGTCQPGQKYETLCDDASGGRYRICSGSRACAGSGYTDSSGADCNGRWEILPNYNRSRGTPCQILGLDSRKGTCQPGQKYETLCDDASGGRYRICSGSRACAGSEYTDSRCTSWDFRYNRPCPPGYTNPDCRGGCERITTTRPCENWDYTYNQPCPDGFINYDCAGGCERRY